MKPQDKVGRFLKRTLTITLVFVPLTALESGIYHRISASWNASVGIYEHDDFVLFVIEDRNRQMLFDTPFLTSTVASLLAFSKEISVPTNIK